ncbi:MAG TPA: NAD(P)-dependent oxidoreductase [Anaerolineae bacterium]|nr:NAD(P)-dependent oxidoreductase [Anaerolineae bacterium]
MPYKTVFTTERGFRHQRSVVAAAPEMLKVTMLRAPDRETLRRRLADGVYWISERAGTIDADLIASAPHLQLIQRLGSLWYDIDLHAAQQAGVAVCYSPVSGAIRVAEHVVLQMLALAKKLREAEAIALEASPGWGESRRTDEDTFAYNWSGRVGVEGLWQSTIGILGFGEIGAELARRLQGWDCRILYNKRRRLPEEAERALSITYAEVGALAGESDHLVVLLPYFPQTDHLLDAAFFRQMKAGTALVSCGSGSVIDETALAEAVRSGHLSGAALDTYEWEPLRVDNPLLPLARAGYNVLLTPHIAAGVSAQDRGRSDDYANIVNHIQGRPLRYRLV